MIPYLLSNCEYRYRSLSRAMSDVLRDQWRWLFAQYRFGLDLCYALLGRPAAGPPLSVGTMPAAASAAPAAPEGLEQAARERLQQGLAPPRAIYDVQNRGRIDWSTVPDWARPSDPELFEGTGHEG